MVQPRRPAGHFTQDGSHHQAIYSSLPGEAHTIKLSVQYHCLQDMPDSMSEEEPEEEPEEGPAKVIGVIYIYIYIYKGPHKLSLSSCGHPRGEDPSVLMHPPTNIYIYIYIYLYIYLYLVI
jgi:hypothetical protein